MNIKYSKYIHVINIAACRKFLIENKNVWMEIMESQFITALSLFSSLSLHYISSCPFDQHESPKALVALKYTVEVDIYYSSYLKIKPH